MFKMNKNGMGMVEVLVAAAMAAMVSLGVATMMQNSMKESRRVQLLDTLKNKKIQFDNMMRDPDIWNATLNNNAAVPFTQLRSTNNSTSEIAYTSPVEFKMYNSDGSLAFDLLGPSDTSGNGFTEKGGACTTFNANAGSGTDNCPFSYRLLVAVDCMSGTSCTNPNLKLVARLVFNPSSTGVLSTFKNFINPVSGFDISDSVVDNKYDSVIKRTSTTINRSFRLISGFIPADLGGPMTTNCSTSLLGGSGGGRCSTTVKVHERTSQTTVNNGLWQDVSSTTGAYDPYDLVTVVTVPAGTGAFTFNEVGYYGCTISVPAFATNSFTAYFTKLPNTDVAQSTVTAGLYSQAVATIDAKFNVTSTSDQYAIRQKCETPGTSPNYQYCTLGIPTTTAYGQFYSLVTVNCYKLDKSM